MTEQGATQVSLATLNVSGYQVVEIDDDTLSEDIEKRFSDPKIVLGFLIKQSAWQERFSVMPVTTEGVTDSYRYALIRPDGKIEYYESGRCEAVVDSLDAVKANLLYHAAELCRETAEDCEDKKEVTYWRRVSNKFRKQLEDY